jgi:uncharacterized membrane protein YjgN (DUF898 family)
MTFQDTPAPAGAAVPAGSVPAVPRTIPPSRARFAGRTGAFWRIQLRGAVLLAFTLGIYRFWLATDVRRFLWSNTEIAGDGLEYNGTAAEILAGFLVAVALLIPINLGVFLLALTLGPGGELAGVLGFSFLFVLGQYAIYRARRYRLTRTVFRGIRCQQTGSALRFALCATFWWMLTALTLGLAYPFAQASLERYKMRNTHYGNLPGRFEGSGFRLFLRGFVMWLLVMAPFVLGMLMAIGSIDPAALDQLASRPAGPDPAAVGNLVAAAFIAGMGIATAAGMALLLLPAFQAMMLRWWLAGLRFGELAVVSRLPTRKIYGAYLRFLWYALLFSLAASVAGFLALIAFGTLGGALGEFGELAGVFAWVAFYVVMMLGYSAIYQTTVRLALWRHGVDSAELHGVALLDEVRASGGPGSPFGEGLADALNVGGI